MIVYKHYFPINISRMNFSKEESFLPPINLIYLIHYNQKLLANNFSLYRFLKLSDENFCSLSPIIYHIPQYNSFSLLKHVKELEISLYWK